MASEAGRRLTHSAERFKTSVKSMQLADSIHRVDLQFQQSKSQLLISQKASTLGASVLMDSV